MNEWGCDSQQTGHSLKPIEEALSFILERAEPVGETEQVVLAEAQGRVLAQSVSSPINVPPWDNSAMDGYALNSADLQVGSSRLPVTQRIAAGSAGTPLEAGSAARIFTGAPLPPGADTVVIQEACRKDDGFVIVEQIPPPGANIRSAGEDILAGAEILAPGLQLLPQHLGLAASVGISALSVFRRLRVAVFSSGDELVMPGASLGPG
ncbi:MAG: molybdopterin molybdotransferase MoeA, partial [Gammaproteobacteria bacterium]|nr:molybdopterin molybdotransferase MoeA [Gammaproteobacteria bacterium]